MKSIAFDISSPEFSEKQEEKSLFDFKPSENIQPNDVVGWYEKIYKEKDEDHSKIYEVDPLDENQIFWNRKSSLFTKNNVVMDYAFVNSYEMTSNEQFTLNFDNLQLNTEEIIPKYPEYEYNHYKSSFSHKIISHNRQKEECERSEFKDFALNEVTKAKINSKSKTEKIEGFYSDNDSFSRINSNNVENDSKRWGRLLDQKAFEFLSKELAKVDMDLEHFLFDSNIKIVNQSIKWEFRISILKQIIRKFGWHKTTYFLFMRLRKLAQTQTFSSRELKILKKVQN